MTNDDSSWKTENRNEKSNSDLKSDFEAQIENRFGFLQLRGALEVEPRQCFFGPLKKIWFGGKADDPSESGRSWVEVDGLLTESGRSFRKWTVRQKVDDLSESGRSVESGRSICKWTFFWRKVDGPSESGRSFDGKWTVFWRGPSDSGRSVWKWTVLG